MKLSVSLSEDDVAVLDEYTRAAGLGSRSAAVQHAIHLLRHVDLEADYTTAWDEWDASGERTAWESVTGDGLVDAPR
ncbi:MAG: antitoxin [Geodermatophilaceae bacterium]|nr:antitoxin [Geodermatophilaceae bacterium]